MPFHFTYHLFKRDWESMGYGRNIEGKMVLSLRLFQSLVKRGGSSHLDWKCEQGKKQNVSQKSFGGKCSRKGTWTMSTDMLTRQGLSLTMWTLLIVRTYIPSFSLSMLLFSTVWWHLLDFFLLPVFDNQMLPTQML